jgi:pantetheine-phosphate adenylyltransferase
MYMRTYCNGLHNRLHTYTKISGADMSEPVIAIYPGTFDPVTLGHEDIVARATKLFDTVIVAVAVAHHKKTLFPLDDRLSMAREVLKNNPKVKVMPFDGLMRDFVREQHVKVMVRGVRIGTDFDYEFQLAGMNRQLMPDVETVFLTPSAPYQFISSTFVREIALLGGEGDGNNLVSPPVYQKLMVLKAANVSAKK